MIKVIHELENIAYEDNPLLYLPENVIVAAKNSKLAFMNPMKQKTAKLLYVSNQLVRRNLKYFTPFGIVIHLWL